MIKEGEKKAVRTGRKRSNVLLNKTSSSGYSDILQTIIPPAVLLIITSIIYFPTLNYPFQFDDIAHILKKFVIRTDNPLNRWWSNSRWLGDWLNTLNFQLSRFEPFYYRLFSLFVHVVAGIAVFYLISLLCNLSKKTSFMFKNSFMIACTTMALFLLHPVQTQTVMYVVQARVEGLATLLMILSLIVFIQIIKSSNIVLKLVNFLLLIVLTLLSCGTKEIIIVLPFLLVLVDWFFISHEQWANIKYRLGLYFVSVVPLAALMVYKLGLKFFIEVITFNTACGNNIGNVITERPLELITPYKFFISEFKVILHYIGIFFWPFSMSVEYDWKLSRGLFALDAFIPLIILLSLLVFVLYKTFKKQIPFFTFGVLWFFVTALPRASIYPAPELIYDYKTYLSSIGLFLILSVFITKFVHGIYRVYENGELIKFIRKQKYGTQPNILHGILLMLVLPLGAASHFRTKVWRTNVEFWQDNVKKAPNKARTHNNLGVSLSEAGRTKESIIAYKKAIDLDKYYRDPFSNLAVAYSFDGEIDKAIDSLKQAIHVCPEYAEAYNNLGSLLTQKDNLEAAEKALNIALKLRPHYGKACYNFARLYEKKKQPEKIWEYLKKATEGDLDIPDVFFKLGKMSMQLEKYTDALEAFEQAISRGYQASEAYFNLANAHFMLKNIDRAQLIYERLVADNPTEMKYAFNLAETLYTKNEHEKALMFFNKAASLPNPLPATFFRVAECLCKMKKLGEAKSYLQDILKIDAPDNFKKEIKNSLAKIEIQEKLEQGKGSIRFSELKNIVANKDDDSKKS
jgi:protein O-mannosyl-transferase